MSEHFERVGEAFSRKAQIYDEFGRGHPNLDRMRKKVYGHLLPRLQPGARILELNAGTGADAAYFASLGYRVHATDIAPGMLDALHEKAALAGLEGRLTVQACSFTDLDQVRGGPYDAVYSNLGGLNCVGDLGLVTCNLEGLLVPGGWLTWVIMPPVCPWELVLLLIGDWKVATRRLRRIPPSPLGKAALTHGGRPTHAVLANVEGVQFTTYYYWPRQVLEALGPGYRLEALEGLSIFAPPADRKNFTLRYPRLYRFLAGLDERVSKRWPFNRIGDFFILSGQFQE